MRETADRSHGDKSDGFGVRRHMQVVTHAGSGFPKSRRLLRHADFQRVYKSGRRQFTGNMTVFFLRRSGPPGGCDPVGSMRVGFTVGRVLGGSVERNRLKRRMREAVRASWPAVEGPVDVVFHPRKSVLDLPFTQVVDEVARGLQVALQRARYSASVLGLTLCASRAPQTWAKQRSVAEPS